MNLKEKNLKSNNKKDEIKVNYIFKENGEKITSLVEKNFKSFGIKIKNK